jgi:metal-dependent amidase/aminoacylase/carboxypeptidase family protein
MGAAETRNESDLKGTVKFIFQPAEEGAPLGEEGGASLMVGRCSRKSEWMSFWTVDALTEVGKITYKPRHYGRQQ